VPLEQLCGDCGVRLPDPTAQKIRFEAFELDRQTGELYQNGTKLKLQGQPIAVLTLLLEHPGELVTREEIRKHLWPEDTFVDFEHSLNTHIKKLRQVFDDDADTPRYIETLPRRGYRFIAEILAPSPGELIGEEEKLTQDGAGSESPVRRGFGRLWHSHWRLATAIALVGCAAVGSTMYVWLAPKVARLMRMYELQRLVAVPLTALPGNVASPAFSPDGSEVAFAWDGESNGAGYDLYIKTIGPDRALRVTHHPSYRLSAAWSPDGRNIALCRVDGPQDAGIYLVAPTGGAERKLTSRINFSENSMDLSWSPDGKQLAFTDHPENASWERSLQLFVLSLDTLERKPVETGCTLVNSPAFSPKGDQLAWVCVDSWSSFSIHSLRLRDGRMTKQFGRVDGIGGLAWSRDGRRMVFTAPLDFGDIRELKVNQPDYALKVPAGHDASSLAVSPTGNELAYVAGIYNVNIWRVDLDEPMSRPRKLIASSREQKSPSISPDGTRIAFESTRSGTNELWISEADGSSAMQLTNFGIRATGTPRWSPDGKWIAFDSRVEGEANLYVIDPNHGIPRKIEVQNVHGNNVPNWSRDGKWIYFVHAEDAHNPSLWKVPAQGGNAVEIAPSPATYPVESPDGMYLYFVRNWQLWRSHTDGSAPEEVKGMPRLKLLGDKWALQGSGIYFLADREGKTELNYFDLKTKQTKRITTLEKAPPFWMGEMSVSGDGRWLVYPQVDEQASNLMMIENWQ
jgi:Tol biopolymer transport system component/DNA-binding winged helix-turn-helix (wHTH) protein